MPIVLYDLFNHFAFTNTFTDFSVHSSFVNQKRLWCFSFVRSVVVSRAFFLHFHCFAQLFLFFFVLYHWAFGIFRGSMYQFINYIHISLIRKIVVIASRRTQMIFRLSIVFVPVENYICVCTHKVRYDLNGLNQNHDDNTVGICVCMCIDCSMNTEHRKLSKMNDIRALTGLIIVSLSSSSSLFLFFFFFFRFVFCLYLFILRASVYFFFLLKQCLCQQSGVDTRTSSKLVLIGNGERQCISVSNCRICE